MTGVQTCALPIYCHPGALTDAAMGDDLAVSLDGEFGAHEAIGEFARLDAKWAHVLRHRWGCVGVDTDWLKDHLQNAVTTLVSRAIDQHHEMRRHRAGHGLWCNLREKDTSEVDAR